MICYVDDLTLNGWISGHHRIRCILGKSKKVYTLAGRAPGTDNTQEQYNTHKHTHTHTHTRMMMMHACSQR